MTGGDEKRVSAMSPESEAALIDRICDDFEDACRQGRDPRIDDYLGAVAEPLRTRLFRELLLSDLEFRGGGEDTISTGDYLAQFPDRADDVGSVIASYWSQHRSRADKRREAPADGPLDLTGTRAGDALEHKCGNYVLLEEVARGGMGIVFRANDTKLQRTVALKMILDRNLASEEAVQRFYAEAETAASLNHPGIVPVYDVGSHEGHHYYAMGFVEGPTLSQELRRRRFTMEEAAQLILDLTNSVAYAHDHGVVHRDLKPGNILISEDGLPQITDFGLAKRTDRPSQLTMAGQILGTPGYMAPEQAAGDVDKLGAAVDIYALGAILYHLISGHPPFRTALDALVCILEQDPVPPRVLNRHVPRDLNVICMKCLSKSPADRYASARELAEDLQRFLNGDLIQAKPASLRRRVLRWARHRPRLATVLVTMMAFYIYHLICLGLGNPGSKGFFHYLATFTTILVCAYAWVYQTLMMRPRAKRNVLYCWVATDILVLTLFLMLAADGATSPLVVIYLCMVASAALSFDRNLVWLVTAACVVSYEIVVVTSPWCHPELSPPPFRHTVPVAISVVAIGLIQYYVLRCSRVQMTPARSTQ